MKHRSMQSYCTRGVQKATGVSRTACRAVLHLLTLNKRAEAAELWQHLQAADSETLSPKSSTVVQFTLLLLALVRGLPDERTEECASAFILLKDKYAPVLARDPELEQMSTKVGERLFGLQPQPGRVTSWASS